MLRWAIKGVKGMRLRAERLGGRWYTTPEAIEDFVRQVSEFPADAGNRNPGPVRAAQLQTALDHLDRKIARRIPGRRTKAQ